MAKHFKPLPRTAALRTPENTKCIRYNSETGHYEEIPTPDNGYIEMRLLDKMIRIDIPELYFEGITYVYIGDENEFVEIVYEDN